MTDDAQDKNAGTPVEDGSVPQPGGPGDEKKRWLDEPGNVRKIYLTLWVVSMFLLVADLFYEKHAEFPIEALFGFFAFFGFVSYVFIVISAKQLRKLVRREEDYYDR